MIANIRIINGIIRILDHNIKKVIYNNPATIVFWEDGTKTVVKCAKDDTYDKEKGLLLCIAKKYFGNTGHYNEVMKKWCWDDNIKDKKSDKKPNNSKAIADDLASIIEVYDIMSDDTTINNIKYVIKKHVKDDLVMNALKIILEKGSLPKMIADALPIDKNLIEHFNILPLYLKRRLTNPIKIIILEVEQDEYKNMGR